MWKTLQNLKTSKDISYGEENSWIVWIVIPFTLVSILIGFFFIGWFINNTFRIKRIEVYPPTKKISFSFLNGTSSIFFDQDEIEKRVRSYAPQIKQIVFTRSFPSTIHATLTFYTPVAQIVQKKQSIIVGENVTVIQVNDTVHATLPRIYYFQVLPQHEQKKGYAITRRDLVYAFSLLQQRNKFGFRFNSVTVIRPGHFSISDEEKKLTVLLTSQKTIDKNIQFVHNSIKGLTLKGIKPRIINVEFDQPIITL